MHGLVEPLRNWRFGIGMEYLGGPQVTPLVLRTTKHHATLHQVVFPAVFEKKIIAKQTMVNIKQSFCWCVDLSNDCVLCSLVV